MVSEIKKWLSILSTLVYMAPVNAYIANMHRVPTYAEIIQEAIIHPTDKIQLPDRQATFIRNLPQMTRFDEVDDPADMGKEQELIQKEKLKALTLRQLAPGQTASIERVKEEQRRPQDTYTPAGGGVMHGPPNKPPSILQRGATHIASGIGNTLFNAGGAVINYITAEPEPPFQWMSSDYSAAIDAQAAIKAQYEQEDMERMSWFDSWASSSAHQSNAALNTPSSTAHYHLPDHDPPNSGGASSSSSGSTGVITGAVDREHLRALAEARRRANIAAQSYQPTIVGINHRGPDPGGGGNGNVKQLITRANNKENSFRNN
jgi:hypothetical protein